MTTEITTNKTDLTTHTNQLDLNPTAAYLAGLKSQRARTVQLQALRTMAEIIGGDQADPITLPWHELRYSHSQAIRTVLAERYKAATANRFLSALRGVLRAAFLLGLMTAEDYHRAAMVKAVTGETIPAGRDLDPGELSALMADCENDPTPAGARDAAIIAILYSCGLRRAELVSLTLADYDQESGQLVIHGKRNKDRLTYLVNGASLAVSDWLALRGSDPGALFCAINKGGRLIGKPMTDQAIYKMLAKRGQAAGMKTFSPHDLRRTFASDMLQAGADIATVAKLMGHASVNTTARYDRRPEEEKRKAVGLLHIPYHSKVAK